MTAFVDCFASLFFGQLAVAAEPLITEESTVLDPHSEENYP